MALRSSGVVARVMNLRFFRFLGKYSYGIYVFHIPIFEAVEVVTRQPIADHIHSRVLAHLVTLTCALAIIIPVAILSFNLYEKPFLKLKRYFNYAS